MAKPYKITDSGRAMYDKLLGVNISDDYHTYLKLLAIDRGISMSQLIRTALYEKYGKLPTADDKEEDKTKAPDVRPW